MIKLTFVEIDDARYTSTKYVYHGEKYGTLPSPIYGGHKFMGWYTSVSDGQRITEGDIVYLTSDTTLYARWQPKTYTITFDANGGVASSILTSYVSVIYVWDDVN